ncbi:uncharacterized protein PV09_03367 [Verruconis gallopava]|uniref:RING-type domain-containing protein n=1 Tax=Verruconis gallopava TaxID=253628 RepID=A0A0D2AEU1_9PEZI|nr:uncharacterized protein PV09_03367 [Verruconis gallopava]KIW05483.1 hypothetical protein PV09_03367 [Verruconis gallopava]
MDDKSKLAAVAIRSARALSPAQPPSGTPISSTSPSAITKIALCFVGALLLLVFLMALGYYLRHPVSPVVRTGDWQNFLGNAPPSASAAGRRGSNRSKLNHVVTLATLDSKVPAFRYGEPGSKAREFVTKRETDVEEAKVSCSICLEVFDHDTFVRRLMCEHIFHASCAENWLCYRSSRCPVCRADCFSVDKGDLVGSRNHAEGVEESIVLQSLSPVHLQPPDHTSQQARAPRGK